MQENLKPRNRTDSVVVHFTGNETTHFRQSREEHLKQGLDEIGYHYVIEKDGKPFAAAIENSGKGFSGDLGVMVGFNLETGDLVGAGVTSHTETPGVGSRTTEESFTIQFRGMSKDSVFNLVWTYAVKELDKRKKARCTCDGSTRAGQVRVLDYTYANCVDQTSSRLF